MRETVGPALANISVSTIMQMLYKSAPAAAAQARALLAEPANKSNARAWLYLACALGQQHADARKEKDDATAKKFRDEASEALRTAVRLEPLLRGQARRYAYTDEPTHNPGDDDLASF